MASITARKGISEHRLNDVCTYNGVCSLVLQEMENNVYYVLFNFFMVTIMLVNLIKVMYFLNQD